MRGKKALNRKGHILFSLVFAVIILYILKDFITLSFPIIILHLPIYVLGAITPDFFEPGGKFLINHQKWIHKSFWGVLFLVIPLSLYFAFNSSKLFFIGVPFNYGSLLTAFFLGFETHTGIDKLARVK